MIDDVLFSGSDYEPVSRQLVKDNLDFFSFSREALAKLVLSLSYVIRQLGIYGVLSYSVARRTSEFGVRLALGARSHMLLWMILRESIVLLALGIAIGVPIALSSSRLLKSQLYELSPLDPTAISMAIAAVSVMTIAAAWLPARRATKIDPMQALRTE